MGAFSTGFGLRAGNAVADSIFGKGGSAEDTARVYAEQRSEEAKAKLKAEKEKELREANRNDLESIISTTFGSSGDEITETLNALFAKAKLLPTGLKAFGDKDSKKKKTAIIEKIEFGLMKLQKADPDSVAFFQTKFDELKGTKK